MEKIINKIKPKKKKFLYYICLQESTIMDSKNKHVEVDRDTLVDVTEQDLEKYSFAYVLSVPEFDTTVGYSMYLENKKLLKFKKLSDLIDEFVFSMDYEEIVPDDAEDVGAYIDFEIEDRIDKLCDEYFVMKMDVKTKRLTYVDSDIIRNCIHSMREPHVEFKFERFTNSKPDSIDVDYMGIFTEYLDKCFGKNKSGVITFISERYGLECDISKTDKTYFFGIDENQNELFKKRLFDLFSGISSCTLRVFTDNIVNKIPIKEIYGFVLVPDFTIKNVNYLEIKDSYTTHHGTGQKIEPEKNVVYCDVDGNRLCPEDIEN